MKIFDTYKHNSLIIVTSVNILNKTILNKTLIRKLWLTEDK